jgi:hypothetical protein
MRNVRPEPTGEMPVQDTYQGEMDINESFVGRPGEATPLQDPSNIGGSAKPVFNTASSESANGMFGSVADRQKTTGATPPLPPVITPQIY